MPQRSTSLPIELVETIFELAVLPLKGQGEKDHLERQQTGLTLSLTSKTCQELVEPLLYRRVTLRYLYQVVRFKDTLATSRAAYVSKYTKALWIVCDDFEQALLHIIDKFLEVCGELDHIVLCGRAVQIFQSLPQDMRPYRLRQLTLIDPIGQTHLSYLELPRLHIITSNTTKYYNSLLKITPANTSFADICIEAHGPGDLWKEIRTNASCVVLVRLLQILNEQCRVRLKIPRKPRTDGLSHNEWWMKVIENSRLVDKLKDTMRRRLQVSVIDDDDPFLLASPTFVDRAFRSIDQELGTLH